MDQYNLLTHTLLIPCLIIRRHSSDTQLIFWPIVSQVSVKYRSNFDWVSVDMLWPLLDWHSYWPNTNTDTYGYGYLHCNWYPADTQPTNTWRTVRNYLSRVSVNIQSLEGQYLADVPVECYFTMPSSFSQMFMQQECISVINFCCVTHVWPWTLQNWQESSHRRQNVFKVEPKSPPEYSHTTSLPGKRRADVKTEPSERREGRYSGMVGDPEGEVQEEEFGAAMDTDSGMDGKVKKSRWRDWSCKLNPKV